MISVVIPTLIQNNHHLKTTLECIDKAKSNTTLPFETVIVETITDYLKDYADIYIWEKKKTNATKSINRGFRCASGDMVVLLTNDVIVDQGWLEHLQDCFKIPDCGLATLGADQFCHIRQDKIEEGLWFSVAMMPKEMAWFDENFVNSWDDSDVVMRTYLKGKKMYRNLNSVVHHKVGMTQYIQTDHGMNFMNNREYFLKKYEDYKNERMYQVLVEGRVV